MRYYFCFYTKLGYLTIVEEDNYIIKIDFGKKEYEEYTRKKTTLINKTIKQINEYLEKRRKVFSIPIKIYTTPFRKEVLQKVSLIPYGKTKSYKEIAIEINNNKAYRAVGMANNKNPIPIIIPCHRVIGNNGNLTGYAPGIEIKEFLLKLEKENK